MATPADADWAAFAGAPRGPQTTQQRDALFYCLAALGWPDPHIENWLKYHYQIDPATVTHHPATPALVVALASLSAADSVLALADLESRLSDLLLEEV